MKIKNLILMLIICSISFFVSGCIKIDTEINIDKKGHVVVSDKVLIDKQLLALSNMSSEHFYQQQIKILNGNPDVQTSQIDEGDYTGTKFVSKFKNLNNIFLLAKYFNPNIFDKNDHKFVKISKNIYKTNYKLDWNANFRELKDENGKRMFTPDTADYISSKLTINIPTKAIKTNATSVINDGLTHVWNFYVKNNYSIQLEFNIINYINVVLTIIGLIFLIIGYIFKQSKLSVVAQKYIFGFSGLLFTYFVIAQIFGNIQYLSFNIYDIGIIIIFLCLSILSFYLAFTKENITENHIEKENAQEIVQTSSESNTKICKYCGGEVSATAKKCKHCGEWLTEEKNIKQNNNSSENGNNKKFLKIILIVIITILLLATLIFAFSKSGIIELTQSKISEINMNEIEKIIKTANATEQGYEDVGQENTIYKLMEKDYNQISSFKDKQTGANTYAFRVQTDWKVEDNNDYFFEYELGRIIINPKDIKKSKCSFNFRASLDNKPVKWIECSDKSFIESIPKIAELKNKAFLQYKNNEYGKLINLFSECMHLEDEGFYDSKCDALPNDAGELIDGWYHGRNEALTNLRNTTL